MARLFFVIAVVLFSVTVASSAKFVLIPGSENEVMFPAKKKPNVEAKPQDTPKQVGPKPEDFGSVSKGSYTYASPDGATINVDWTADGFQQPTSDHLPTPPPTAEQFFRSKVQESRSQKQVGPEDIDSVSKGSYYYVSPDGVILSVNWVADENGFQGTGDHLPTPPPMPSRFINLVAALKATGAR